MPLETEKVGPKRSFDGPPIKNSGCSIWNAGSVPPNDVACVRVTHSSVMDAATHHAALSAMLYYGLT
jgi:hypothetical protein